ncbi:MAG TPA: potassium/proton antiporter [Blastocatellia bacterium]|nr:potassium/proton antiporter [Blastocatellia bacterium]
MSSVEHILVAASALLLISVLASKASAKLGVPALLVFLVLGMLAGSDGPGGIYFDNAFLAQSLGVIALALILFSGGLDTEWSTVRPVLWQGLVLSTVGVVITALLVAVFAERVMGFSLLEGLLLGTIVSSTDAAAVFSVLRARSVGLKGHVRPLLELESGSNDPMAVFMTTAIIGVMTHPGTSLLSLVPLFVQQMLLGGALGYALGKLAILVINRLQLEYEGLYPVLTLSLVLLTYSATGSLGGNGFLAVYIAGLVMGKSDFIHKRSVMRFHDGLAWLMQIAMFLALGLLVFPSHLVPIVGLGLLSALFLIFVARPVAVFVTLLFSRMKLNERAMISWVGLRGAVPIVLATFPMLAGLPRSEMMFDLVFFIVLTSILLQGTSIPLVARWLRLESPARDKPAYPLELEPSAGITSALVDVEVPPYSPVIGRQIVEARFPKGALIVLIARGDEFVVPKGGTVIQPGDRLLVLADEQDLADTRAIVESEAPNQIAS